MTYLGGLRAARAIAEEVADEFSENYWTAKESGAANAVSRRASSGRTLGCG